MFHSVRAIGMAQINFAKSVTFPGFFTIYAEKGLFTTISQKKVLSGLQIAAHTLTVQNRQ